ncbi:hypothetical protein HQ560_05650, partial [bacterium]|nr:hypothetical protein [bacterium]
MAAHERWLAALFLIAAAARGGSLEGVYRLGGENPTIIHLRGSASGEGLVGVVTEAGDERQRQLLHKPVLVIEGSAPLRGRVNAFHARVSERPGAWLPLARCERLPNGDLRCTVAVAEGAAATLLYARTESPPPREERSESGLTGDWRDPGGGVIHYLRYRDSYVGQIIRLSPQQRTRGYRVGEEVARLRAVKEGEYKGTFKVRTSKGRRWEPFEIAVERDTLRSTRQPARGPAATSTAQRQISDGQTPAPPVDTDAAGELEGLWRASHGAVTRYTRDGDAYSGAVVTLSPELDGFGFVVGEESIRLTGKGAGVYRGKVKVKQWGGRASWWEPILVTVGKDTLKYVRQSREGLVEGAATRMAER